MSLPNYLAKIKSAGIYRFVFDKSQMSPQQAETLRLVVGYSEKGPFNTPVYIDNKTDFVTIYGNINKRLERKGIFFHRLALQALSAGPILALNIKPFKSETVIASTYNPANYISRNELGTEIPVSSIYNTNRFWTLDPDQLLEMKRVSGDPFNNKFVTVAATDTQNASCTIIVRPIFPSEYDLDISTWISNYLGVDNAPDWMKLLADAKENLKDYFEEVYVFRGEFTEELVTGNGPLAKYFDVFEGNITLKNTVTNVFGEEVDTLDALAEDSNSNFIVKYQGTVLPEFKDANDNYISIDLQFNAGYNNHKMLMKLNEKMLEECNTAEEVKAIIFNNPAASHTEEVIKKAHISTVDDNVKTMNVDIVTTNVAEYTGDIVTNDVIAKNLDIAGTGSDIRFTYAKKISVVDNADIKYLYTAQVGGADFLLGTVSRKESEMLTDCAKLVYSSGRYTEDPTAYVFTATSSPSQPVSLVSYDGVELVYIENATIDTVQYFIYGNVDQNVYIGTRHRELNTFGSDNPIMVSVSGTTYTSEGTLRSLNQTEDTEAVYQEYKDIPFAFEEALGEAVGGANDVYAGMIDGSVFYLGTVGRTSTDDANICKNAIRLTKDGSDYSAAGTDTGWQYTGKPLTWDVPSTNSFDNYEFAYQENERVTIDGTEYYLYVDTVNSKYIAALNRDADFLERAMVVINDGTSWSADATYEDRRLVVTPNTNLNAYVYSEIQPMYLSGYIYSTINWSLTPYQIQQTIFSVFDGPENKGFVTALTNRVDSEYHYLVDTFASYVEQGCKQRLASIVKMKDNSFGLLNFPNMKIFEKDPRFTSPITGKFDISRIANPANGFSVVSTANGASWNGYFTTLTFSDGTVRTNVPSAGLVSNNFMNKYNGRQPYYVVAGPKYGVLTYEGMVGPDYNYGRSDLDVLEPLGVNAIIFVPRKGTYINSNQTAQQTPVSALSKINVRELIIYLQDEIEAILQDYQWDNNTQELRSTIETKADTLLENVQANKGVYDFLNVCDESNNTNELIDNEFVILDTSIEPTKGAGKMVQRLYVYRTGGISTELR